MTFTIRPLAALLVMGGLFVSGCGGPGYEIAPTSGKVTYNGEPVAGGSITFRPVAVTGAAGAKPASGPVRDDGSFTLTTVKDGDGAAVGKHQVLFTPIMVGAESYDDKPEPSPYLGLVPESSEVEIARGRNTLEVKLVRPSR